MLVTHILSGDIWGGAESQVYNVLSKLKEYKNIDIRVILFNQGELYGRLNEKNIKAYLIDESKYSDYVITRKLKKLISELRPDILHVHDYKSHVLSVFARALLRNKPLIVRTFHGQTISPVSLKSSIIYLLQLMVLKYGADCIVVVSKDLENKFKKKYSNCRIMMIHNAIEIIDPISLSTEAQRYKYGIEDKTFWVAAAARLVKIKNLDMLIDAAHYLAEKSNKNFIVTIFGDGPLKHELKKKINEMGLERSVILQGHCNDIIPILQAIDIFVLTSFNEGLPMSLLEAMSVGTVPVCTNVGGVPEVIDDKINGFLVESNNAKQLSEVLMLLQSEEELMRQIGASALSKIRNQFSLDYASERLFQLYCSTNERSST